MSALHDAESIGGAAGNKVLEVSNQNVTITHTSDRTKRLRYCRGQGGVCLKKGHDL